MFLLLSGAVEGGSGASCTRTREVPPVCIFAVIAVVLIFVLFHMQQVTERSV